MSGERDGQGKQYKNILIIKLSSLGDVIMASPCAVALRELYPQAKISWVVESPFADVVPGKPYIDETIIIDKAKSRKQGSLLNRLRYANQIRQQLKRKKFDLVIDLQGLFKSALLAIFANAPVKLGVAGAREGSALVCKPVSGVYANGHAVERYLDVIRYLGGDIKKAVFPKYNLEDKKRQLSELLKQKEIDVKKPIVVMAPGTRWVSKCWAIDRYSEVASLLLADGIQVVVCGGQEDQVLGSQITALVQQYNQKVQGIADLTGQTNLLQLMALLQQANCYVGGDTGPMHMAVAVGTPVVALFGPIPPEKNGPYGQRHTVVSARLPCVGCRKRVCEDGSCMKLITVQEVYRACQNALASI